MDLGLHGLLAPKALRLEGHSLRCRLGQLPSQSLSAVVNDALPMLALVPAGNTRQLMPAGQEHHGGVLRVADAARGPTRTIDGRWIW
jgi:hypothetical protein